VHRFDLTSCCVAVCWFDKPFVHPSSGEAVITFAERAGTVTMTATGPFNVASMMPTPATAAATGRSTNDATGGDYIVATTGFAPGIDTCYSFSDGTDFSALTPGPFSATDATATGTTGTTPFSLFDGTEFAVCIASGQLTSNEITFDQAWTYGPTSLATLGITEGRYSVVDKASGATLTIAAERFGGCCGTTSCGDDTAKAACTDTWSPDTCAEFCVGMRFKLGRPVSINTVTIVTVTFKIQTSPSVNRDFDFSTDVSGAVTPFTLNENGAAEQLYTGVQRGSFSVTLASSESAGYAVGVACTGANSVASGTETTTFDVVDNDVVCTFTLTGTNVATQLLLASTIVYKCAM
jgi:hypothetical protein